VAEKIRDFRRQYLINFPRGESVYRIDAPVSTGRGGLDVSTRSLQGSTS